MNPGDYRILIVDDEASIRKVISSHLESAGFQTKCAASGKEAVEKIGEQFCHLVILDIKMPGGDGIYAAKALIDVQPEIPVLILSGYIDEDSRMEMENMPNIKGYLSKPFESEKLIDRVSYILKNEESY